MRLFSFPICRQAALVSALICGAFLGSCAQVNVPDARNVEVPNPTSASKRARGVNEYPDSVMYLPLGEDILVPEVAQDDPLPYEIVGPFELRGETLAGALQLILADYDIGLAFETDAAMENRITVTNLSGELSKVVKRVCSLANLYCSYEDSTLIVKETQTFTVTLPPIGQSAALASSSDTSSSSETSGDYLTSVSAGLSAILGADGTTIVDEATRTIIYSASQRTAELANRYFQRLRANTAMIVYETYIWEVQLTAGNSAGIDWELLDTIGKFSVSADVAGAVSGDFTSPISIGLPTTSSVEPSDFINFLSQFGAVKTISQPQITVLSGATAEMRVADTQNYVAEISTTFNDTQSSTSVSTDSVDSGFTLTIGSSWDKATVYTSVGIEITDVLAIDNFNITGSSADGAGDANTTRIQLPQTTERELNTQIRVRPGDSVLIGGLVRERDNFDSDGMGFMEPVIPKSRTAQTQNLELVIMMRPRVIVYTDPGDMRYIDYSQKKSATSIKTSVPDVSTLTAEPGYDMPTSVVPMRPSTPAPTVTFTPEPVIEPTPALITPAATHNMGTKPAETMPYRSSRPERTWDTIGSSGSPSVELASPTGSYSSDAPAVSIVPTASPAPVYTPPTNSNYVSPYETYDYYSPRN